jgi:hypothetical protein
MSIRVQSPDDGLAVGGPLRIEMQCYNISFVEQGLRTRGEPAVLLFRNLAGAGNRIDTTRKLADWARAILKADDDVGVSVLELDCCADGFCEPETVILVMRGDQPTEAITIRKSLETVTYADLEAALFGYTDSSSIPHPD